MEKEEWTSLHNVVICGLRRGGFTMHQFHAAVVIGFVALALVLDDPLYVLLPHRLALGSQKLGLDDDLVTHVRFPPDVQLEFGGDIWY